MDGVGVRTTICALFYGDYPQLAERCLDSLKPLWRSGRVCMRLGANEVSERSLEIIHAALDDMRQCGIVYLPFTYAPKNINKYPMMRWMLEEPVATPYYMWFDDDSYLKADDAPAWLTLIEQRMEQADMLGKLFTMNAGLIGGQAAWVQTRPWYNGKAVRRGHKSNFATGGWWTIRSEILKRFNWPDTDIDHKGGDVMLGELCRQQGLRLHDFHEGVAINQDGTRGTKGVLPVGTSYKEKAPS